jgi:tRNA threonylcarbamoyladenosine biosynthesis protein TsaB
MVRAVKYRMPSILAIETSTELASIALLRGDELLARQASGPSTHSDSVLPLVRELLAEAGMRLADCDAIAFGCGPGSFTGVRTATGVVQGLAYGANLPVIPIVTLLALAESWRKTTGENDVLAMLDARMGEVYWARYRFAHEWTTVAAPALSAPADVQLAGATAVCGNGLRVMPASLMPESAIGGIDCAAAVMPHAAQIASLAARAFLRGETIAAHAAQPLYLRNKVALTTRERAAAAGVSA